MSTFDFSTAVDNGSDFSSLINKPGYYIGVISETEYVEPTEPGKSPYLKVTFETDQGKLTDSLYITEKALFRLKSLFEEIHGKPLNEKFNSAKQVGDFLSASFKKQKQVAIKVIGEKVNDKIYHKLPFRDFVFGDLTTVKPRQVEATDADYSVWVTTRQPQQPKSTETVIQNNTTTNTAPVTGWGDDTDDSLPF